MSAVPNVQLQLLLGRHHLQCQPINNSTLGQCHVFDGLGLRIAVTDSVYFHNSGSAVDISDGNWLGFHNRSSVGIGWHN